MLPRALAIIQDEHRSVAAMLRSLDQLVTQTQGEGSQRFFDVVRAILFYIDEFPERQHHPKESDLLFPKLLRHDPHLMPVVEQLEHDHLSGEPRVRALQHLLLAWELLGPSRRAAFVSEWRDYQRFYLEHMRREEADLLPRAQQLLSEDEWAQLDAAFSAHVDPLTLSGQGHSAGAEFEKLFGRILRIAPAPIGLGEAL